MIKLIILIAFIWLDLKIFSVLSKVIFFPNNRRQDKD